MSITSCRKTSTIKKGEAMSVKVCVDPGSTHMGKLDYCKQLIDLAAETKCYAIKFQLFPNSPEFTKSGNIPLSFSMFEQLVPYCPPELKLFASIWDNSALDLLNKHNLMIKFAYSQRNNRSLICKAFSTSLQTIWISSDVMTSFPKNARWKRLYCIPQYPVPFEPSFEGIFPDRFDGFSDHTLGILQSLRAANAGAQYIEKHITLGYDDIDCPDNKFALKPFELKALTENL